MPRTADVEKMGLIETFAEAWARGGTIAELAEEFDRHPDTIRRWTDRDDVKLAARQYMNERSLKIRRKTDSKILEAIDELDPRDDIKELLAIRKEFAGEGPQDSERTESELIAEAMKLLDENPDKAAELKLALDAAA